MIRIRAITALLLLLTACTTAIQRPMPADARYQAALTALDQNRLEEAADHLAWVVARCWGRRLATDAAVVLVATDLDPRREHRPLDEAAQVSAALLQHGLRGQQGHLLTSLHLVARELGAGYVPPTEAREDVESVPPAWAPVPGTVRGCGPTLRGWSVPDTARVPALTRAPVPARLRALRLDRARLAVKADSLRRALEGAELEIAIKDREIQRLRRLLRP